MTDETETANHYRAKAADVRAKAEHIQDRGIRELMLGIAVDYEHMAATVLDIAKAREKLERRKK
jgi:hypothetical protein